MRRLFKDTYIIGEPNKMTTIKSLNAIKGRVICIGNLNIGTMHVESLNFEGHSVDKTGRNRVKLKTRLWQLARFLKLTEPADKITT